METGRSTTNDAVADGAHFVGVDVGTGGARAGVFDRKGRTRATAEHPTELWEPEVDFAEQSSEDIWQACAHAVRTAVTDAGGVTPEDIRGIGFDAACSMVVVDEAGAPVTVSPSGEDRRNVIVWMDHRAASQAEEINATGHEVLRYVGGAVSPEMQSPKLLWLKTHLPETWERAAHFFDLADYLTYRATGATTRSLCTTVCKWTYLGHEVDQEASDDTEGWADDFWRAIGLGDLVEEGYRRIGRRVRPMGEPEGEGLREEVASEMELRPGTPVGVSIIDAHAGGLGLLGTSAEDDVLKSETMEQRLALIGGTSSCHMAVSPEPRFIEGVWGPYFSAMVPGQWLTEGGQSATGALIDHVIFSHARADELQEQAEEAGETVYEILNRRVEALSSDQAFPALLTRDLHVLPYFHGNRSPRADPSLRGVEAGLRLSDTVDELALLYLATIQAVAHGTRHIIDTLNESGYDIDTIVATGGGTKNPAFLRAHADITGCQVVLPRESEAVLLGAAMLGAVAGDAYRSIPEAMAGMSAPGTVIDPAGPPVSDYHDAKHCVFHRLHEDFLSYRTIMNEALEGVGSE